MKKLTKILGTIGVAALAAGLTPYCFQKDDETGDIEVKALLWSLKKSVGEESDEYTLELLPFLGGIGKTAQEPAAEESVTEEPAAEEPAAEEPEAPAEEPKAEEAAACAESAEEEPAVAEEPAAEKPEAEDVAPVQAEPEA